MRSSDAGHATDPGEPPSDPQGVSVYWREGLTAAYDVFFTWDSSAVRIFA